MKLFDSIYNAYRAFRGHNVIVDNRETGYMCGWADGERLDYSRVIFRNIIELLTDLVNDVTFKNVGGVNNMLFASYVNFFNSYAAIVLNRLYRYGFVVIGYTVGRGFFLMNNGQDYREINEQDASIVVPFDASVIVYVMRSPVFREEGVSDFALCKPFLTFLNDVLNSSATVSRRLGAVVVTSPKNLSSAPTQTILREEEKKDLEKQLGREYGSLRNQNQIMVLPREMNFQTISLAGLDMHTEKKARLAILAIADRIKVPSNQIAIIDANSSKALANGGEQREGDKLKYKTFERLLNYTFVEFAKSVGLIVDYDIYNKPIDKETGTQTN